MARAEETPRRQARNLTETWEGFSPRTHPARWGEDIASLERTKRHEVSAHLTVSPTHIRRGQIAQSARAFDPVLGRLKDAALDAELRAQEERQFVEHCNRAKDVQVAREKSSTDVLHHATRISGAMHLISPERTMKPQYTKPSDMTFNDSNVGRVSYPSTHVGYNIISNEDFARHHWAREEERPKLQVTEPQARKVPATMYRDYNVVTNRYKEDHDEKAARDAELKKLDSAAKLKKTSSFDPIAQRCGHPDAEKRLARMEAAHTMELEVNQACMHPPTMKTRPQAYYDLISGSVKSAEDAAQLAWIDAAEEERKQRYGTKHQVEHAWHHREVADDARAEAAGIGRIHPSRFRNTAERGHDIINNKHFSGRGGVPPWKASPMDAAPPWQRAQQQQAQTARQAGGFRQSDATSMTPRVSGRGAAAGAAVSRMSATASAALGRVFPAGPPAPSLVPGPEASPAYARPAAKAE